MAIFLNEKKWNIQKLLMLIITISTPVLGVVIVALWFSGDQVQPDRVFNIAINLMGLFIASLLYLSCVKDRRDNTLRTACFAYLITMVDLEMFLELWNCSLLGFPQWIGLQYAVDTLYQIFTIVVCCIYWMYLLQVSEHGNENTKDLNKCIYVGAIIMILSSLGNLFGHYYFLIDENGIYREQLLGWLFFLFPLLMLLLFLLRILKMDVSASNKRVLSSFVSMPTIAIIGEALTGLSLSYPAMLCALIFIYGNVFKQKETELAQEKLSVMTAENQLLKAREESVAVEAELKMAAEIQNNTLPAIFPPYPDRVEFDLFASMKPAKDVGGDFYDFFMVDDDHLALVMADVSGKGIPAALFMMVSRSSIKNAVMQGMKPSDALFMVNNQLCEGNIADMFVTVWLGILQISTGVLTACNAGHEYPIIAQGDGAFEIVKDKHGFVVAGMENSRYTDYTIQLEPNSSVFVYTDGVPEATNSDMELFGMERTLAAVNERPNASPNEIIQHVHERIEQFVGDAPQFDDITMLVLKLRNQQ